MKNTIQILEPSGTLNAAKGNEIRQELEAMLNNGAEVLLIDLKDVKFIDSSGLGALVAAVQFVKNNHKQLFICSVNNQVKMLFDITKMDRIITILTDRAEFESHVLTS